MPNNSAGFRMSTYLSTTDVFLAPTPEIRALHDKSILIVTPSGDQMWAKICVEDADREGRDAGKCSVIVWTASTDEREWVDARSGRPPPPTDAVKLIRPNEENPAYDLLLQLPTEEI
jgi:hypothetical protein